MSQEEENKQLTRRFYEDVMTEGQTDLIDKIVADDYVDNETLPGREGPSRGSEALREVVETFRTAFPDLEVEVEDVIAEEDRVVARTTWRGTHEGSLFGAEPTNEPVEFSCIDIVRIEDGQAREHWGLTDTMAMMTQIGAVHPREE